VGPGLPLHRVNDRVRAQRQQRVDVVGRDHARILGEAAQSGRVLADLLGIVGVHTDELETRMADDVAKAVEAHIARPPLNDAMAHGFVLPGDRR